MIPVGTAVAAAAPAGRSEPLQLSGFVHRADLEAVGLVVVSGSGFALPAELIQELTENNTRM